MGKFKFAFQKGLIICFVSIVGKGKPIVLRMALDTGATKTIIPPEAALGIGINPANSHRTTEITTGSGMAVCPIITIPKFSCFGITRKKFEVVCHSLPLESPVEGLLGLNFFKETKLLLDFPKNIIEVTIRTAGFAPTPKLDCEIAAARSRFKKGKTISRQSLKNGLKKIHH